MSLEQKASLIDKLAPVIVGAFLGAVPAITVSVLQSRAAVHQIVVERQFAAIKDFSSACTRRVQLAGRVVLLHDMRNIATTDASPKLMDDILVQHQTLSRDVEDSKVSLQAQIDLANALFSTTLSLPPDAIPEPAPAKPEALKAMIETLRTSLPKMAKQCQDATGTLVSKLER